MAQGHSLRRRSRVGKGFDPFRIMMNEFTKEKPEKIHKEGNGMAQGHSLRRRSRVGKGLDPFRKTMSEFRKEKPEKISNGGNGMAQSHSLRKPIKAQAAFLRL